MRQLFLALLLLLLTSVPVKASVPLSASDAGTCATANACLVLNVAASNGTATFTISGTFSATAQFEGSGDNGTTWVSPTWWTTTSTSSAGVWQLSVAGLSKVRIRLSAYTSGTVNATIQMSSGVSAGSSGSGGGGTGPGTSPLYALYTVYPATSSACTTYTATGTSFYCAKNNATGAFDYESSDAGVVMNDILTNNNSVCGTVQFKVGDYLLNSMTLETTGGYSNLYYAIGIPANAGSANQYCQWNFVGEGMNSHSTTLQTTQGSIFDVTAAGLTSCGTGNWCVAWWHRPDTTNHLGNDVKFSGITTRFPDNTRGNEGAFVMWEAATVNYDYVTATLNEALSLSTPAAIGGANRMIGVSSTMSAHNARQYFTNVTVSGYDIGFDLESEHTVMDDSQAYLCNYLGYYARTNIYGSYTAALISHPGEWRHIIDVDNVNGIIIGSNVAQGSRLDILGYDIEVQTSGTYTRSANMTETNCGYTSGIITYTFVQAGTGIIGELPSGNLFSSCGINFQTYEGTTNPNNYKNAAVDSFTRPSTGVPQIGNQLLGPQWLSNGPGGTTCAILSNAAITGAQSSALCIVSYAAQPAAPDQFSKVTVSSINSNAAVGVTVRASTTLNTQTYYRYVCSTSGGFFTKRTIDKEVAGTYTSLTTTSANSGCSNGDFLELWAVGSTLLAYYTPSGGARTLDLVTTDSSITSGQPGITLTSNASSSSPGATNWTGGSLASNYGTTSLALSSIFGGLNAWPAQQQFTGGATIGNAARTAPIIFNANSAAQSLTVTSATPFYVTNSDLDMPAVYTQAIGAGTILKWRIGITKSAAGTGTFQVILYQGTNGTTSDTANNTVTIGTQTAAADNGEMDIQIVFTSATAYYYSILFHQAAATATGFGLAYPAQAAQFTGTKTGLTTTTASLKFGIGFTFTTGTPTVAINQVQAEAFNVN